MGQRKRNRQDKIINYFNEQSGSCAYCHEEMTLDLGYGNTATVDHIIPKSVLRISGEFNEVACCHDCNNKKGNKPLFSVINELRKL